MSMFDEPGKGRRQCPACQRYTGIRSVTCECGHTFTATDRKEAVKKVVVETPSVKMFDEPGPGRRQCPACQRYTGIRSALCGCGHKFVAEDRKKVVEKAPEAVVPTPAVVEPTPVADPHPWERMSDPTYLKVYVPAGECPVKLQGTSLEDVAVWSDAVRARFKEEKKIIGLHGLTYFARTIYDFFSPEFQCVKEHLLQLYGGG